MALSKPVVPDTVQDESVIAQHYLVCGTEDCERNCQFYCNDCHQPMCEQCQAKHQKSPDTKNHEMVPYQQRKIQPPVEKCEDHPTKDVDMICEDCQVPVCSKCVIQDHQKHSLNDLETIYSEKFTLCLEKVYKIHQYFIPNAQDLQRDIRENAEDIKKIMNDIRRSMKTETTSLKCLLETVLSDKIEQVNKMEESLIKELQSQDKTYEDYISYLKDLVKEVNGYMSSTKLRNNPILFSLSNHRNIRPLAETIKPVPPVFTAGQCGKEDVTKLMGRVTVPNSKPENRKIKPMETASTQYKKYKYSMYLFIFLSLPVLFLFTITCCINIDNHPKKPTLSLDLSSSVTKVREYTVPDVNTVMHTGMSVSESGRLWASNFLSFFRHLIPTDKLQKTEKNSYGSGFETVTLEGDLIYAERFEQVISKITLDNTTTELIKTGDWEPISVHSSRINGDILVGMVKDGKAKVTRYDKTGTEIQNILWDNEGQELYSDPNYITENINGDICTSDFDKSAVVVVDKSGQHRFTYTDQGSEFIPSGIKTDILGHILVCDFKSNKVHILDQDGQLQKFLFLIFKNQQEIGISGVFVDEENHLHVGQTKTNTVTVYKYLQ